MVCHKRPVLMVVDSDLILVEKAVCVRKHAREIVGRKKVTGLYIHEYLRPSSSYVKTR